MFWEKHNRETYECPDCGRQEEELLSTFEVHHKDGQPMDNRPENHVALCRPCLTLREGKKPSIEEIRNLRDSLDEDQEGEDDEILPNGVNRIYTSGSMHYHNDEDSTWRASVQGLGSTLAEIVSPKDVTYDHGGDLVAGVAGKDLELLDSCDAVVAYFDKEEQVGTLTELMYAGSEGKPALGLFHQDLIHGPAAETINDFPIAQAEIEEGIGMRFESPVYWFLINTLISDSNGWVDGESWDGVKYLLKCVSSETKKPSDQHSTNGRKSGLEILNQRGCKAIHIVMRRGSLWIPYPAVSTMLPTVPTVERRSTREQRNALHQMGQ